MSQLQTRIITYAWGDRYVEDLLNITVPALLAPGNLPHLVARVPCELVILTEEKKFARVKAHPVIQKALNFCPLRLISIDDLVSDKGRYGMALTYTLHRGFADLGARMTDAFLFFLNADFVIADGGIANVLARLQGGQRIVAAPSYCATADTAKTELKAKLSSDHVLALKPRELADICLRHRHNTVKGKTVNKQNFHIRFMDQFYWEVDEKTLLGHQMPIAIVGMRPERHLAEPNSYWDYGLMKEFVPDSQFHVIGDSDEFMMLELREKDVAQEQISSGWPTMDQIASDMMMFLTDYQRSFAAYSLTLHAGKLPENLDVARRSLKDFAENILSFLPQRLPSHIGHAQWDYHFPRFLAARHKYLSSALAKKTELEAPPDDISDIDRIWWRYDGLKKRYERQLLLLTKEKEALVASIRETIEREFEQKRSKEEAKLLTTLDSTAESVSDKRTKLYETNILVQEQPGKIAKLTSLIDEHVKTLRQSSEKAELKMYAAEQRLREIEVRFDQHIGDLNLRMGPELATLSATYEELTIQKTTSAITPYVRNLTLPQQAVSNNSGLVRTLYSRIVGVLPKPTFANPYWPMFRRLQTTAFGLQKASNTLVVANLASSFVRLVDDLDGFRAAVSVEGLLSGNLSKLEQQLPVFDLCLCELLDRDLPNLSNIINTAKREMNDGGTIILFYLNPTIWLPPLSDSAKQDLLSSVEGRVTVTYSGSILSAWALSAFRRTAQYLNGDSIINYLNFAIGLTAIQPIIWIANAIEMFSEAKTKASGPYTSMIVEIQLMGPNRPR